MGKNARKLYISLKNTALYDRDSRLWNNAMYDNQRIIMRNECCSCVAGGTKSTEDQLMGAIIESLFDRVSAKETYQRVKNMPVFYDEQMRQFKSGVRIDEDNKESITEGHRCSDTQLLAVLCESLFNKEAASELYRSIKQTPLYDVDTKYWNSCMSSNQALITPSEEHVKELIYHGTKKENMLGGWKDLILYIIYGNKIADIADRKKEAILKNIALNHDSIINKQLELLREERLSENQLLGILVEYIFDKDTAFQKYENLKKSPFYDSEGGSFRIRRKDSQYDGFVSTRYECNTYLRLLEILVEAQFNKEMAGVKYEATKNSDLYDSSTNQWNAFSYTQSIYPNTTRFSYDQLLGIWVESLFE